jgi:polyisoprenoid-binding protein YceI
MLRSVCLFTLLTVATLAFAQPEWTIVDSDISFEIVNAGITVDGSLSQPEGEIRFDPVDLSPASLRVSVPVSTLETGLSARDHHLMAEKYFYVDQYPNITMRSVEITQRSANAFDGVFALTIKETTQQVRFPFTFRQDGKEGSFDGEFSIDRLNFDVGGTSFFLDDEVRINLQVVVKPLSASATNNLR